jgi:hypothetical protein
VIGLEGVIVVVDGNEVLVTSTAACRRWASWKGREAVMPGC